MQINTKLFLWLAVFFLFFSVVYPTWNYIAGSPIEWVGTLAIPLTMVMFLLLGGFLYINLRRQAG
jgi:TRAP-type C4-dicarboxylate transport system permease small subunit